ncbi:MAG TPA: PaaI family thioesterase [Gemmatimonadaceae bacterium]
MNFKPADPGFDARVRASFSRQKFMATIGAEIAGLSAGSVHLRMKIRDDLTQQHGFLHAGALASLADSACGYAALTLMPADAAVLSIEFKINMLSPARGDSVIARAEVIRAGKTIMACRADVSSVNDTGEKLVAAMQGTMMVVRDAGLSD